MDLSSFHQNLPIKFKELVLFIHKNGFKTGVVGGIARDFILSGNIGIDFDCELRPIEGKSLADWIPLIRSLNESYKVEELSYKVVRISLEGLDVEITLPRLEHFDGSRGHSNFKAEHIEDLDYSQGFYRRDFTINAIMFEFDGKGWNKIDPLAGEEDLQNKTLRACSSAFAMDPVRFLRAFRFRVKLVFDFCEELEEALENMELDSLSAHYIKLELSKSKRPVIMLKRIMDFKPSFISELIIHGQNKPIIEYDQFYNGDVESHFRQAVVLPAISRELILKTLGFSVKQILPNITFDMSWKSLIEESFDSENFKQFYETVTKLENLTVSDEKLEYLFQYYGLDFTTSEFSLLKKQKYELTANDKEQDKSVYKYIVLQKRLREVL